MTKSGFESQRGRETARLITDRMDVLRCVYFYFREFEGSQSVSETINYVVGKMGGTDTWTVLAAIDVLHRSKAVRKSKSANMKQNEEYEWGFH